MLICLVLSFPRVGDAADHGAIKMVIESLDVFGEGTAVVYTDILIAPQFYRGKLILHVFYKFALIVKADRWQHIIRRKIKLREVVLDELNRYMFARPDAPNRINIPLLKKRLLLRAKKLLGATSVHGIYVMNAISGRVWFGPPRVN